MNPYEILGLKKDATDEDIRNAYKKLARKWHPDTHNQESKEELAAATEKFKEVNSAYELLSDSQSRAEYDRYGAVRGSRRRPTASHRDFNFFGQDFDSVFNQFFKQKQRRPQGEHIQVVISLTLNDIVKGCVKEVKYNKREQCGTCNGAGGTKIRTCPQCSGQGSVNVRQGPMLIQTPCPVCRGMGEEIQEICDDCKGVGLTSRKETKTDIKIPAGVESGMQLFFQGQGEPAKGKGTAGNLYILVKVEDHEFFHRGQNGDLLCTIPVSYTQLVLGSKIAIPTLDEVVEFSIPPGTQTGSKFKLKSKGLPKPGAEYRESNLGSIIATVEIEVPTDLSDDYVDVIKKLEKLEGKHITPKRKYYDK
tara:strand:- start:11698 stop:12786 length:1089 start_codon:yes stop_codon:yes gene_type:complete